MKFISPEFLYALGFLSIPILIHLFNFRRYKTVKFSQVKFLKDIKQETQSVSRLKHLLILLTRCLAITLIVLAFAQPYIPSEETISVQGRKGVSVYIDNSFSMQVKAEKGSLIDIAKEKSIAIINAYEESDKFHLITNDFKAKNQRWLNKNQMILEIQKVKISPIYRPINDVINRMQQINNEEGLVRTRYLVSDLQQNSFKIQEVKDSSDFFIIPVQNGLANNVVLDQTSFQLPYHLTNQNESLNLTLKTKRSEEPKKVATQLYLNQQLKTPLSIDLTNQDSINETINYRISENDAVLGKVCIKDFPVTFDDTLYFNYSIQKRINVLHLFQNEANYNLATLFSSDSLINYSQSELKQIDYSSFDENSLIILDNIESFSSGLQQELVDFNRTGGTISIFPSEKMELNGINSLLLNLNVSNYIQHISDTQKVSEINSQSQVLQSVFKELPKKIILPTAYHYWQIASKTNSISEKILAFQNQGTFISQFDNDYGKVFLSSVGLSSKFSNFSQHALFVPILYNIALQSVKSEPIYYNLNNQIINLNGIERKESPVHIVGNGIDIIPKQQFSQSQLQINLSGSIRNAGHYKIIRDNQTIRNISFNYNRDESIIEIYSPQELIEEANILELNINIIEEGLSQINKTISEIDKGTTLWKYFIILALIFLLIEMALLRILK